MFDDVEASSDSVRMTVMAKPVELLAVAIDFGTTFSGFAFSFSDSKDKIFTGSHGQILQEDRVPTVVLLNPDKSLKSFGNQAKHDYLELICEELEDKYYFFEHFKMILYSNTRISRSTMLDDVRNQKVNAMHVFVEGIKYLVTRARQCIGISFKAFREQDICWILTIPAIWSDSARQFMREAALRAGLPDENLRLVLEPEAASLFCREMEMQADDGAVESFQIGYKYILADLGGGTVDICVHEIVEDGHVRELYSVTGGCMGGNQVNQSFIKFLCELFGEKVWSKFRLNFPIQHRDMLEDFESTKKLFCMKGKEQKPVQVKLEAAFVETVKKETKKTVKDTISKGKYKDSVEFKASTGRLQIKRDLFECFFLPSVDGIILKLKDLLKEIGDPKLRTVLLAGGFGESSYVRDRISDEFSRLKIAVPRDPRLAVLKGAVLMGYKPRHIVERIAPYSYGFAICTPYEKGAPSKLKKDGKLLCVKFSKLITKGQVLKYGQEFSLPGSDHATTKSEKQRNRFATLLRSEKTDPKFKDEDGCVEIGEIEIQPPEIGWPDHWKVEQRLVVGETEFSVKYLNKTSGEELEAKMNFL